MRKKKAHSLKNSHLRGSLLAEARTDVMHFYDTFSFALAFGKIINLWKTCLQIGIIFFQHACLNRQSLFLSLLAPQSGGHSRDFHPIPVSKLINFRIYGKPFLKEVINLFHDKLWLSRECVNQNYDYYGGRSV